MNDRAWLNALVPITIPIVIYILRRSAASKPVPQGATQVELTYGLAMKIFGLVSLWLGLYLMGTPVYRMFVPYRGMINTPKTVFVDELIVGPCGLLLLFLCAEAFFVRHHVDAEGLTLRSVFHRPYRFAWHEIAWIDFSPGNQWFVVRALNGRTGRISHYMGGVKGFAEIAQAHLAPSVFRQSAWKELERCGVAKR